MTMQPTIPMTSLQLRIQYADRCFDVPYSSDLNFRRCKWPSAYASQSLHRFVIGRITTGANDAIVSTDRVAGEHSNTSMGLRPRLCGHAHCENEGMQSMQ
jgi:hypothetical protein